MIQHDCNATLTLPKTAKIGDNYLTRLGSLDWDNEQKCLARWRRETSNTTPNPVAMDDYTFEIRHKDCITYMLDWAGFYAEKLTNFDDRLEQLIVDLFIRGTFFQNKHFSNSGQPLRIRKFDIHKETRPASGMKWSYAYTNQLGLTFFVSRHPDTNKIQAIKFEATGHGVANFFPRNNYLDMVDMFETLRMIEPKLQAVRIDTTIEVPHTMLSIFGVKEAVDGRHFSGVKKAIPMYGIDEKYGYEGLTVYFGKPRSEKRVRIYETGEKHGYHAIRIELQNRGKHARLVCSELISIYNKGLGLERENCSGCTPTDAQKEQTAKLINEFIRDYTLAPKTFNLVDRDSKKPWRSHLEFKELPFWTKFKADLKVQHYTYHFEPIEVTIQKKVKNMLRNLSGIHRLLSETIGKDALSKILRHFDLIHSNKYGGGVQ